MPRVQYAFSILRKYIQGRDTSCPHCGGSSTSLVGTKYLLLQLRKCLDCELFFRWPKDTIEENYDYYNNAYHEGGITVEVPSCEELKSMLVSLFRETDKDFKSKIDLLKQYKDCGLVLDYGASWGYVAYQLVQAGYDVTGFEIDGGRASYGYKCLDLNMISDVSKLHEMEEKFDIVFTSHVLEHLPDLHSIFADFFNLLHSAGLLLIFVPNCTGIGLTRVFAKKKNYAFGEKHAFAFTADFFKKNLPKYGFQIVRMDVSPYEDQSPSIEKDFTQSGELMILAQKIAVGTR